MKLNLSRNVAAMMLLVALAIAGLVVLICLGHDVPDALTYVILTGVGALAGTTLPSSVSEPLDQLHTIAAATPEPATATEATQPAASPLPTPAPEPPAVS